MIMLAKLLSTVWRVVELDVEPTLVEGAWPVLISAPPVTLSRSAALSSVTLFVGRSTIELTPAGGHSGYTRPRTGKGEAGSTAQGRFATTGVDLATPSAEVPL